MKRRLFFLHVVLTLCAVSAVQIFFYIVFFGSVFGLSLLNPSLLEEGSPLLILFLPLYFLVEICMMVPQYLGMFILLRAALRRWHDIGHGDLKFVLYFYIVPVVSMLGIMLVSVCLAMLQHKTLDSAAGQDTMGIAIAASFGIILLYMLGLFLYLACKPSEPLDNAFGTVEGAYHMRSEIRTRPRVFISIWQSIFRAEGRLNRKRFIFGLLAVSILQMGIVFILSLPACFFHENLEPFIMPLAVLFLALCFLLPMRLFMQRLRDVGKSPLLWSIPAVLTVVILSMLVWLVIRQASPVGRGAWMQGENIILFACIVYYFICVVYMTLMSAYLFFAPGDAGENAYGENPLVPVEDVAYDDVRTGETGESQRV